MHTQLCIRNIIDYRGCDHACLLLKEAAAPGARTPVTACVSINSHASLYSWDVHTHIWWILHHRSPRPFCAYCYHIVPWNMSWLVYNRSLSSIMVWMLYICDSLCTKQSEKKVSKYNFTYVCVWENLPVCAPMHRLPLCMASFGSSQHGNGQMRGVYLANIRHIWHLFIYIHFTHTFVRTRTRTCGFHLRHSGGFSCFLDLTNVIDISILISTEFTYIQ